MNLLPCCCNPILADEFKQLALSVPWFALYTKFTSFGVVDSGSGGIVYGSGYSETKYTTRVETETNHSGSSTGTTVIDSDSGQYDSSSSSDPGYIAFGGGFGFTLVSETVTDTYCVRIRTYSYINPVFPFNTLTGTSTWEYELSVSVNFSTKMATWRTRFETMLPLASMDVSNDLNFRDAGVGASPTDYSLCLISEGGSATHTAYNYILIKPYDVGYPWDSTYQVINLQNIVLYNGIADVVNAIGASPMFLDQQLVAQQPPVTGLLAFISTELSLHNAVNCSAANTENRDCAIVEFDPSDGSVSATASAVSIVSGKYAFNGFATEIFSGSITSPGTLQASGIGWVDNRVDLSDSANDVYTVYYIDDSCAP